MSISRRSFVPPVLFFAATMVACGSDTTSTSEPRSSLVPVGALSSTSIGEVSYTLSIRDVGAHTPALSATVGSLVADSIVELSTPYAELGVVLAVDNYDPRAPEQCHRNAMVRNSDCPDRSTYPFLLLDSSPILEVYVDGRVCMGIPGASAAEVVIDSEQRLLRMRAVAPVVCDSSGARTLEIHLVRPRDGMQPAQGPHAAQPITIGE